MISLREVDVKVCLSFPFCQCYLSPLLCISCQHLCILCQAAQLYRILGYNYLKKADKYSSFFENEVKISEDKKHRDANFSGDIGSVTNANRHSRRANRGRVQRAGKLVHKAGGLQHLASRAVY